MAAYWSYRIEELPLSKSKQIPDDLSIGLDREVLLVCSGPGDGKSYSIAKLAEDGLKKDFKLVVIDRDRGLGKALKEVHGKVPDNLDYFLAKTWGRVEAGVQHAFDTLKAGDWLIFEMAGAMWDFVQTEYAEMVYGDDLANHILDLRITAEERVRELKLGKKSKEAATERSKETGFSGLDGRQDWSLIKRMHNANVFERAVIEGEFNILTTTALKPLEKDEMEKNKWPMWDGIGKRPEGEKHQVHRHDTIIVLEHRKGQYFWRTDLSGGRGKDRGSRELARDIEFTGQGVVASYLEYHEE